jgi:hypothetical protein
MKRATRSFRATNPTDGEVIDVKAGVTHVDGDHWLAREYADDFEPEERTAGVSSMLAPSMNGGGTRTRSRSGGGGTPRRRLSREQELEVRAARLREIQQREADGWADAGTAGGGLSRALGPESREERNERAFWDGINAMLWPDAEREQRASTEFFDEMKEIETRRLAAERESLSDWLDRT